MLSEPTEKKSGTCRNFWKFAKEIVRGSWRSPRRLGYSLKSSQDWELAGSPSEEIRGHIGSLPKRSSEVRGDHREDSATHWSRHKIENLSEFSEVRRRDHRRFTEITEKARLLVKVITSSGACWEFVGRSSSESSPEQDSTFAIETCLGCVLLCSSLVIRIRIKR